MGKESPTYLDPQISTRTNLLTASSRKDVVGYFVKAMRHYSDKEILVILFNTGNHWVILAISTKYHQVWYCDCARPTDSITDKQLTRDWTDIMAVLDSKFLLHFSF
jgi:ABC-type bacteriocin/lantibiotic exporter with double-glycine peptidase domain